MTEGTRREDKRAVTPFALPHYTARRTEGVIRGYEKNRAEAEEQLHSTHWLEVTAKKGLLPGDPVLHTVMRREELTEKVEAVEKAVAVMQKKYPFLWREERDILIIYRSYERFSLRAQEGKKPLAASYRTWKRQRAELRYYVAKEMGWMETE